MAEMFMSDGKGNEVTFERDGSISIPGITKLCDRCDNTRPSKDGQKIMDASGEVIMWFCFQCRLEAYIK